MSVFKEANLIDMEKTFIFEGQTVILKEGVINFQMCYEGYLYLELLLKAMMFINAKWFSKTACIGLFFNYLKKNSKNFNLSVFVSGRIFAQNSRDTLLTSYHTSPAIFSCNHNIIVYIILSVFMSVHMKLYTGGGVILLQIVITVEPSLGKWHGHRVWQTV